MQLNYDSVLVLVEHLGVIDLLEGAIVGFGLVRNAVVHETGSSLEILDNGWWDVLDIGLVRKVLLLSLDEQVLELRLLDCWVHVSSI